MNEFHLPSSRLLPFIECYWHRQGHFAEEKKIRVVADACTDVILEFAPTPWPARYVIGTQLKPIIVSLQGEVDRIAVRFRPGMAWFFFRASLDGLTDRLLPLSELSWRVPNTLYCALAALRSLEDRAARLDDWLVDELVGIDPDGQEVEESDRLASALRAGISPARLACATGLHPRRLQRVCRERFGATAAHLHRLFRFSRLLARVKAAPGSLAELALELGYADQAHMAREFRHFAGTSITTFIAEQPGVGNLQDEESDWLPVAGPN